MEQLAERLVSLQTKGYAGACWGYNFPWQARAFYQPKFSPTVVATTFAVNALLDAYDLTGKSDLLQTARSSCEFVLKDLNRVEDDTGNFCFTYSPTDHTVVFNASLLGSHLLSRVYSYTGESVLIDEAKKSVQYCCDYQRPDGSWTYGSKPYHQWIDSFHTGYNLEAIGMYGAFSGDSSFDKHLQKGLDYYLEQFFDKRGQPRYYSHKLHPIDLNSSAQVIITLSKLKLLNRNRDLAENVVKWAIDNMWSSKGYFSYQKTSLIRNNIPYMRWTQAWMLYALSCYLTSNDTP